MIGPGQVGACPQCGMLDMDPVGFNAWCNSCQATMDVNTGNRIEMALDLTSADVLNLTGDMIGDLVDPADLQGMGEEPGESEPESY